MIPVNQPVFRGNEINYLTDCVRSGWVGAAGPFVPRFEEALAQYTGRKHAIAVSSGTAALDVAMQVVVGPEHSEVIAPVFTYISTVTQLKRLTPWIKFVDCDPHTFNIDVNKIAAAITSRTRAIVVAHLYGLPVDMDPVLALAKQHGLKVIEDAAQAVGWTYKGKQCGSFGDVSTFSFFGSKTISCGEGGMILTDDDEIAARCRGLAGMAQTEKRYQHYDLGWNFRMTNMQAAVGLAQFERLGELMMMKLQIAQLYDEGLSGVPGIQLPTRTYYADNNYWAYPVVFKDFRAQAIAELLKDAEIDTRPFFWPMHRQPPFKWSGGEYPVADYVAQHGLCLPVGPALMDHQIDYICDVLRRIL